MFWPLSQAPVWFMAQITYCEPVMSLSVEQACGNTFTQALITQPWPMGQAMPHLLQLALSLVRLASQPWAGMLSQLPKLGLQLPRPHLPATQVACALAGTAQPMLHAPQFLRSVLVLTSQPSFTCRLQSAKPAVQAPMPHMPAAQAAMALFG